MEYKWFEFKFEFIIEGTSEKIWKFKSPLTVFPFHFLCNLRLGLLS